MAAGQTTTYCTFQNSAVNDASGITTTQGEYFVGIARDFDGGPRRASIQHNGQEWRYDIPGGTQKVFPMVRGGVIHVMCLVFTGYKPGTQSDNPDRRLDGVETAISCGEPVGLSGTVLMGPPGPRGWDGSNGNDGGRGPQGQPGPRGLEGIPGKDASMATVDEINARIGHYDTTKGETIRGQLDAIQSDTARGIEGQEYIATQNRSQDTEVAALRAQLNVMQEAITRLSTGSAGTVLPADARIDNLLSGQAKMQGSVDANGALLTKISNALGAAATAIKGVLGV
jgi:hypothetical protein